jgi:hypothetical protein
MGLLELGAGPGDVGRAADEAVDSAATGVGAALGCGGIGEGDPAVKTSVETLYAGMVY